MYQISHLLKDFSGETVAKGSEMAVSECAEVRAVSVNSSEFKEKRANDQGQDCPKEELHELQLRLNEEAEDYRELGGDWNTRVIFDEKNEELVWVDCCCQEFRRDYSLCRHAAAALISYIRERDGEGSLLNTPVERLLSDLTGQAHPFVPGLLRKTGASLVRYLNAAGGEESTALQNEKENAGLSLDHPDHSVRAVCVVSSYRKGGLLAELRVGEKRLYVVKNIPDFLTSCEKRKAVSFGKSFAFVPDENAFSEGALEVLDYMNRRRRDGQKEEDRGIWRAASNSSESRYLTVCGEEVDRFLEKLGENGIFLAEDEKHPIYWHGREEKRGLSLEKQEYGAVLKLENRKKLAESLDWLYELDGDEIVRVRLPEKESERQLFAELEEKKQAYISEKDLPEVCRNLLPAVSETTELACIGINPEQYLPKKASFELFLDYPQPGMISCRGEAVYSDGRFPLFREKDPKENRDYRLERTVEDALRPHFQSYEEAAHTLWFEGDDAAVFDFLTKDLEEIGKLGNLYISDALKRLQPVVLSGADMGVSVADGMLQLNMASSLFSAGELAEILSAYKRKKKFYRFKNGMFAAYDNAEEKVWAALSECIKGAGRDENGTITMPLYRAMYLDEMLKDQEAVTMEKSREYRRLLRNMKFAEDGDFEVPSSLQAVMRGYQKDGFFWLKTLKANGFGGILADDMGLGKTLQMLAFLLSEKEEGKKDEELRTLIVAPASLVYNWKHEIERFVPELTVCPITGGIQQRKALIEGKAGGADIWVTSYDLLKRDVDLYKDVCFANQVIDEAQYVKNYTTQAAKAVRMIKSSFRMALTGTPIENRLSELWSIFDYLMPGFLFPYRRFREEIETPVVSDQDEEAMERLRTMIRPFVLRRLKKDVLKDLPDKLEETVTVELEGEQKKLYQAHAQRLAMVLNDQTDEEFAQSQIKVLAELTKLRQICCGPEVLFADYKGENAKLETCMELLHQAIEGGHRVLLFSQFTSILDLVGKRLKEEEIPYYRIDGSVSKEERTRMAEAFGTDEVMIFCISLKAGGTGLNLTAADVVIHYDPWWNLAAQNQATDRAHRIGQTNVVSVYQLIAEDTVEERIQELQQKKYELAGQVLSGEGMQDTRLNRQEIMDILRASEGGKRT